MTLASTPSFWSSTLDGSLKGCDGIVQDWIIRVFFPGVEEVFLGGEFNRWSVPGMAMEKVGPQIWETRLTLPNLELPRVLDMAGCFGFVRGRLAQVRYFPLGIITADREVPATESRFELLRHEIL